jgi:hypothetical protein
VGFPGIQVNPLVPARRTVIFPCGSISATVAALATSGGAADRARAILVREDSFGSVADGSVCICATASEITPTIAEMARIVARMLRLLLGCNIKRSFLAQN